MRRTVEWVGARWRWITGLILGSVGVTLLADSARGAGTLPLLVGTLAIGLGALIVWRKV
jgi:hypothetical protein